MPEPKNKIFWQFRNLAGGRTAELLLYGSIADESQSWFEDSITPKLFAKELADLGPVGEIIVRINSRGGDVFAAQTIGNLLEDNPAFTIAKIDGMCGSAATVIASHCDKVIAANDSTYMIHPVSMGIFNYVNAAKLQEYISALATIKENIISLYVKKTGQAKETITQWMDSTSWWTGPQAKENGFVDELADDNKKPVTVENRDGVLFVNSVDMGMPFDKAPDFLQNKLAEQPAAGGFENTQQTKKEEAIMEIKNADDLRKQYPGLVNEIERAAAERAANQERQRIKDIEEMALPGSEKETAEAKFTKPMAAADYAVATAKRLKAQGEAWLKGAVEDAAPLGQIGQDAPQGQSGDEFMAAIREAAGTK